MTRYLHLLVKMKRSRCLHWNNLKKICHVVCPFQILTLKISKYCYVLLKEYFVLYFFIDGFHLVSPHLLTGISLTNLSFKILLAIITYYTVMKVAFSDFAYKIVVLLQKYCYLNYAVTLKFQHFPVMQNFMKHLIKTFAKHNETRRNDLN